MRKTDRAFADGRASVIAALDEIKVLGERNGREFWNHDGSMPFVWSAYSGQGLLFQHANAVYRQAFNETAEAVRAELRKVCGQV